MRISAGIALAALGSGVPSTVVTIARRGDVLESTRAAGTLLVGDTASPSVRILAGGIAHAAISSLWGTVLWRLLPVRHTIAWGAASGVGIAALDLGLFARWFPAIRRLPRGRQVADHVAFGLILGWARSRAACRPAVVHGGASTTGTLAGL